MSEATMDQQERDALASVNLSDLAAEAGDGVVTAETLKKLAEEAPPTQGDPGWEAYVLSLLSEDEKSKEGFPMCHGLRRLAAKLIGPVVRSIPNTVQAPAYSEENYTTIIKTAVVEWHLAVLCIDGPLAGRELLFGGVGEAADVSEKCAAATAAIRAEAMAYGKCLGL